MEHLPLQSFDTSWNFKRINGRNNGLSDILGTLLCVITIFDGDDATVLSQ